VQNYAARSPRDRGLFWSEFLLFPSKNDGNFKNVFPATEQSRSLGNLDPPRRSAHCPRRRLFSPPTELSSQLKVAPDVPVKGCGFSLPCAQWLALLLRSFSQRELAFGKFVLLDASESWQLLSSGPLRPLTSRALPVSVSTWPVSSGLVAAAFQVDESFFAGFWIS